MNNNINKQLVTIVVPIYKQSITEYEEISFKQLFKILGKHEITIIKPTSLDLNQMLNNYPTCKIESFSEEGVLCKIISSENSKSEPDVFLTLYQALPKGDKFEFVELKIKKAIDSYVA